MKPLCHKERKKEQKNQNMNTNWPAIWVCQRVWNALMLVNKCVSQVLYIKRRNHILVGIEVSCWQKFHCRYYLYKQHNYASATLFSNKWCNVWVATQTTYAFGGGRRPKIEHFYFLLANDNNTQYKKCLICARFTICNLAKCLRCFRNYRLIHIIQSSSSSS